MTDEMREFLHWMSYERQLSDKTCQDYLRNVQQWIGTGDDARIFILDGTAISTRRVRRAALLAYHKFVGLPLEDTVIRGRAKREPVYADKAQVERVLVWLRDNRDYSSYMVAALMYRTGMRPAEACEMELSGVNMETRMVTVIGKGDKERHIPATQELIDSLRRWMGFIRPRRASMRDHSRLLLGPRGGLLDEHSSAAQTWRKDLYAAYDANGLGRPHQRPAHWLRHMFATHAVEAGITLHELSYLMGHEGPSVTMVYIHRAGLKMSRAKLEAADAAHFGRSEENTGAGPDRIVAFPVR